ncbi:MAG: hypothetical protein ACLGG5_09900 [Thermoleophilia bacterium]
MTTEARLALPAGPALTSAPAVEVLEVVQAEPSRRLRGSFRVELADSVLDLTGWALGLDSAVARVEVVADGEVVGSTEANAERPDIAAAFPDTAGAGRCGFGVSLAPSGRGESRLAVEVTLEDGARVGLGELRVETR